jgi:hypothetical protein
VLTVYPPAGVFGFGRYRTAHRTVRPLAVDEALRIVQTLDAEGIYISARIREGVVSVELEPTRELTTRQEARALAAFAAKTDARITWRQAAGHG